MRNENDPSPSSLPTAESASLSVSPFARNAASGRSPAGGLASDLAVEPRELREPSELSLGQLDALCGRIVDATGQSTKTALAVSTPTGASGARIVAELSDLVQRKSVRLLQGVADEGHRLSAIRPVVAKAVQFAESDGSAIALSQLLSTFSVEDASGANPHPNGVDSAQLRFNFQEGIRRLLKTVAANQPTIVLLSELHLACPDTLDILEHVIQATAALSLRGRPEDARLVFALHAEEGQPGTSEVLERLGGLECVERVRLQGLVDDELARWLSRPDLMNRIRRATDGLPQKLEALFDSLPELLELQERRESELSAPAVLVLRTLREALLPLGSAELVRILGHDEFGLRRVVLELQKRAFIDRGRDGRLRTTSRGQRAVRLQSADPREPVDGARERRMHRALGELFADRWTFDANPEALDAAARHLLRAGDRERAVEYGLRAGRELQARQCLHGARELYIDLLAAGPDSEARHRLLLRAAEVSAQLGRHGDAVSYLSELSSAADTRPLADELTVGQLYLSAGSVEEAISALSRALPGLHSDPAAADSAVVDSAAADSAASDVHAGLARALFGGGELERALMHCDAAGESCTEAMLTRGNVRFRQGRLTDAARIYRRVCDEADQPLARSRALHNLGLVSLRQRRWDDAVRALRESQLVCEGQGEYYGAALCHLNLGVAYEHMERFALAEQFLSRAVDVFARIGHAHMAASATASLADLARQLGDTRRAYRLLRRALAAAEKIGSPYEAAFAKLKLARVEIDRGRFGNARTWLQQATDAFERQGQQEELAWAALYRAQLVYAQDDADGLLTALDAIDACVLDEGHEVTAYALLLGARADLRAQRFEEAAAQANEAAEAFASLGIHRGQVEAWTLVATGLEQLKRLDEAESAVAHASRAVEALVAHVPRAAKRRFGVQPFVAAVTEIRARLNRDGSEEPNPAPLEASSSPGVAGVPSVHPALPAILGASSEMTRVGQWVERVADTTSPILLRGESGTGKELVAEAIHTLSARRDGPFVRVNVAALPEGLLESELFGHERGAFTGAVARRKGKFEAADGGTLFLDEIGDISPKTQVRLLRVLQSQCFERVGGSSALEVDVRVICATHQNLEAMVENGAFRLDLYHRIHGVTIALPALRDRETDALLLARHFLRKTVLKEGRVVRFSAEAEKALVAHDWPGNVRELENVVQTAYLLSEGEVILADALQLEGPGRPADRRLTGVPTDGPLPGLDDARRNVERELIEEALRRTNGNITRAAELLQVKRPRLSQKIRDFGIAVPGRDS